MPNESTPLIAHITNDKKPITSERPIRLLVQGCFDEAADKLEQDGDKHEANLLRAATVHWLPTRVYRMTLNIAHASMDVTMRVIAQVLSRIAILT